MSRTIYVEEAWGDYGYGLLPGVYYLVAKPNIYEGYKSVDAEDVTIYVKTTPRELGEDFYNPFELGTFGENFALADSANTIDYQCDYNASDNYWDNYSRHDVVYRFTLTEPMEIAWMMMELNVLGKGILTVFTFFQLCMILLFPSARKSLVQTTS